MSRLAPLLEIQALDLAADAARARSAKLPDRETIPILDAALAELDVSLAAARAEEAGILLEEERLGQEVTQVAREIEVAELDRYSGKRKDRGAAVEHDESQKRLRERQLLLEGRELELLESIERIELQIEAQSAARAENRAQRARVLESIRAIESEVEAELIRLEESRSGQTPSIPQDVLDAYHRNRSGPRAGGRGAASLDAGLCGGCRIKLPSMEIRKMLATPADSLIQCPQCLRVLVR